MSLPNSAQTIRMSSATMTSIACGRSSAARSCLRRPSGNTRADSAVARSTSVASAPASRIGNPRIDHGVQEIDEEIDQRIDHGDDDSDPHDGRVVEGANSLHGVEADAGPGEDNLDQESATEEIADLETQERGGWDQGVPESVPVADARPPHPFGLGRADVVLSQ